MRVSPAFQVTVRRMGVWQGAVAFCIGAALTATAVWRWQSEAPSTTEAALAGLSCLLCLLALRGLRSTPVSLRWDSQCWWIGSPDESAREQAVDRVEPVIDLSFWMLLRVRQRGSRPWAAVQWIPVQRRGLESQWHALRCAIYTSPAPATRVGPPRVPSC